MPHPGNRLVQQPRALALDLPRIEHEWLGGMQTDLALHLQRTVFVVIFGQQHLRAGAELKTDVEGAGLDADDLGLARPALMRNQDRCAKGADTRAEGVNVGSVELVDFAPDVESREQ